MFKNSRPARRARGVGLSIVWPRGLEQRYGISAPTRWRWERDRKLPARDVFVGGVAVGWRPETLEAADRGELPAPGPQPKFKGKQGAKERARIVR